MGTDKIIIQGAREHNLKNINIELPRNKLVVITGLSGSGKSTLAFDTLYAEGQRRYVESLSTYARQFLERLEKPDVDMIEGLSPAISIEQKNAGHNPRSTVGTITEIYDYLRLLFARVGTPFCYKCQQPITSQTLDQIIDRVMALPEGKKIIILSPVVTDQKGTFEKLFQRLRKDGFSRVQVDGKTMEIENIGSLEKNKRHTIEVVVDRLIVKKSIRNRLADSLELSIAQSEGLVHVEVLEDDLGPYERVLFNEKAVCAKCGMNYPEFSPASFSFNSPHGACRECDGLGVISEIDPDLIIPNKALSIREGAVTVWANRNSVHFYEFIDALTSYYDVDIHTAYKELTDEFKEVLLYGTGDTKIPFYFYRGAQRVIYERPFIGIIPQLKGKISESKAFKAKEDVKKFLNFSPCPSCSGTRLNPESRSVRIDGHSISQVVKLTIKNARRLFLELKLKGRKNIIATKILKEVIERLEFLENVGLGYLTLDRSANTLSGGESQRIRLATQIGSKLTGVLYVLDEPSIGLHQRDNRRLLETLLNMRDIGNSVLVVEHDEETIRSSDHVIDMGPGAGVNGGDIVFSGTPDQLVKEEKSLTGLYLSGKKRIEIPLKRREGNKKMLIIKGACEHNLKNIDVTFPLGTFICVTGVSGSGKSTLVLETIYPLLSQRLYHARVRAGGFSDVLGLEHLDKVVNIDQSPIGRTPRSNPGTYTGAFSFIRELFSRIPEARMRGYKAGRFSFNVKGGRCEACGGDGIVKIEMHFLPDIYVTCDVCHGKRYNRETLEIKYKGKNIADILNMTVNQGCLFFKNIKTIKAKLETLVDVGLGYIQIGQSATTLSGGEAQRIKLSRELSKKGTGKTIYILDEPTTGLHMDDIQKLLNVLNKLVNAGNTVIVIEHNMDVIKTSDYIIDLGPEGGDEGGFVVTSGTPEKVAQTFDSYTGQFLDKVLNPPVSHSH